MKHYSDYKASGFEWLGEIPEHWTVCAFKHCASIDSGLVDPRLPEYVDLPLIAPNHVESGTGRLLAQESAKDQGADSGKYLFERGAVIYSKIRPALAKACIPPSGGLCSADMYPLTCREDVDPRFLLYVLISDFFTDQAVLASERVAMPKVNRDTLGEFRVALPPLDEQRQLADYLDRKTVEVDRLIAEKRALLVRLGQLRASVIYTAVTKGLDPDAPMKASGWDWIGGVPDHWTVPKIKFVARVESGHTPSRKKPEYWENCTIPWVTLGDVWQLRNGRTTVITETKEKISELGIENSSARLLPERTVILSRTASVGFSGILGSEMATSQDYVCWVCGPTLRPTFLLYVLRAMKREFRRLLMGSTHKTIYMPDASEFVTTLPPVEEQDQIVAYVEDKTRSLDALIDKETEAVRLLTELRSSLISEVVTGKIDVREDVPVEMVA